MKLKNISKISCIYFILTSCTAIGAIAGSNSDSGGFTLSEPYYELKVDDELEITLESDSKSSLYLLEMNDNMNKVLYLKEKTTQKSVKIEYQNVKKLYQVRNGNGLATGMVIGAVVDLFVLSYMIKNIKLGGIFKF